MAIKSSQHRPLYQTGGGGQPFMYPKGSNIGWNTIVPGLMDEAEVKESHTVPVMRLDEYFRSGKYRSPEENGL